MCNLSRQRHPLLVGFLRSCAVSTFRAGFVRPHEKQRLWPGTESGGGRAFAISRRRLPRIYQSNGRGDRSRRGYQGPERTVLKSLFASLYRITPSVLTALTIVRPETVIRWHRAGFRLFWRWKSRSRGGRPKVPLEIRQLIREMSVANPLWGALRIHGELLTLGIAVGQTSVTKYMARHRRPPSQGWKTFLRDHAGGIASLDLFVVPTISFRLLCGLLILSHGRRQILWLGVTAHPTAEWLTRQLTEDAAGIGRQAK